MKSKIIHIGKNAISEEPILVLFGEEATDAIRDVALLQTFEKETNDFLLQKDDEVYFGDQVYTVTHVGKNVGANLMALGHVTFVFAPFDPEHFIETSIYLTPHHLPTIEIGMTVHYLSR